MTLTPKEYASLYKTRSDLPVTPKEYGRAYKFIFGTPVRKQTFCGYEVTFYNKPFQGPPMEAPREMAKRLATEARDREIITRLCRQSRYRKKYEAMGIWPLPAAA